MLGDLHCPGSYAWSREQGGVGGGEADRMDQGLGRGRGVGFEAAC